MKISIRQDCDFSHYITCMPWYASPEWKDSTFDVTITKRNGGDYYMLENTPHNKETLRNYEDALTNRGRMRLNSNKLTSFCVDLEYAELEGGGTNQDFIFLLKGDV